MLTAAKYKKLLHSLKDYQKKWLNKKIKDLDESGTRLMINALLTDVLGYASIEEIKTEYMIKGTYADYVIQIKGIRYFLVEVKSLSLELSEKHLRQAINYGANEGIEWALLTNGRQFELYRVLFNKPIEGKKVFSIDLSDRTKLKDSAHYFQYLHRDSVIKKGLEDYWNRCVALDPITIANILRDARVVNHVKKALRNKFRNKFTDGEVLDAVNGVFTATIDVDAIKKKRIGKIKKQTKKSSSVNDKKPFLEKTVNM